MSVGTSIEWTDASWNPVVGCTLVSRGCLNCYAASFAARGMHKDYVGLTVRRKAEGGKTRAVFNGTVRCLPKKLTEPFGWKKPRRVFVNSMSDLFHEDVPFSFIAEVFTTMAQTHRHTYQILTKRPDRMVKFFEWNYPSDKINRKDATEDWLASWPNVWMGTSVEDQQRAEERIPHLRMCPAAVRFLSCEPLLGELDLRRHLDCLHWVIVGGESGPHARPYDIWWPRSIRGQCLDHGVPFFHKQVGSNPVCAYAHHFPNGTKVLAGGDNFRVLLNDRKGGDPAEWPEYLRVREMPEVSK